MISPIGHIFSFYGAFAYPLGDGYIIPPYRGGAISRNQMIFNKRMSAVRICVEWAFGKVLSLFAPLNRSIKMRYKTIRNNNALKLKSINSLMTVEDQFLILLRSTNRTDRSIYESPTIFQRSVTIRNSFFIMAKKAPFASIEFNDELMYLYKH
jgi:hypothetical protein